MGERHSEWEPARVLQSREAVAQKPSEKTPSTLTEVHARAALRDDPATDHALATDEVADFGTHP
jgi:hypothetical protein